MAKKETNPIVLSQEEAKAKGLRHYFTGKACRHGHVSKRLTSSTRCCQCDQEYKKSHPSAYKKQYMQEWQAKRRQKALVDPTFAAQLKETQKLWTRQWRAENRERNLETDRRSRAKNKEKRALSAKKYGPASRARNHEKIKKYISGWIKVNYEKVRSYRRNRKARERGNGGSHTGEEVVAIFKAQGGKCAYCRIRVAMKRKHVDHIIPISKGGRNDKNNLQILCQRCNLSKKDSDPIDYARNIGRLL